MDIAIISFYRGINNRGVERWVSDLTKHLSGKHTFTIYQNSNLSAGKNVAIYNGNLIYETKNRDSKLQRRLFIDHKSLTIFYFTLKILKKLFFGKHQIIIPTDGGWESAIVRLVCWLTGKKMIIAGQAGVGYDDLNNLWCFPDCFVALSSHALKWAEKINPFVRLVKIPNAVDTNLFVPIKNKIKGRNILCVGALTKEKRIDLVIKAVAEIDDANLTIVGSGQDENYLKTLAFSKLGKKVKFIKADFEEMPKIYQNADLLVSTSVGSLSFEMVLVEAMACNVPVVANDDPIRREIVGDAGFLVNPDKTSEFVLAIKKALNKDWGNIPRKRSKLYSWDKIALMYDELFENIFM